jgi:hypothetical protein
MTGETKPSGFEEWCERGETGFGKRVQAIRYHADSLGWIDESHVGDALSDSDAPLHALCDEMQARGEWANCPVCRGFVGRLHALLAPRKDGGK